MEALLRDMATMPIVKTEVKSGGTQLKLIITFAGESNKVARGTGFIRVFFICSAVIRENIAVDKRENLSRNSSCVPC